LLQPFNEKPQLAERFVNQRSVDIFEILMCCVVRD
jgi:hypothetical protein